MGQDLKFIVLNDCEKFALELRAMLQNFDGVKIVAEVDEPALLVQAVSQFPVDILFVNLDPNPETILPLIGEVSKAHQNLVIFASSESADGPLILKVMRLGVKEFLPKPVDKSALGEAINRVASHRVETAAQGKLITVLGTAGGVGTTMLATNLGVELAALTSGNVTIVDLDYRFAQVATLLDVEPPYSLADLCDSPDQLDSSVIARALARHSTGVQVLSRPSDLTATDPVTTAACMKMFSTMLHMNDYVVADGPTRFDLGGESVLALSDVNLLVVQLLVPCVRNAARIIESMRSSGYNLDRTKLVCNRMGRESGHLSVEQVTKTLGLDLFASIPNDWVAVSGAINLGEPFLTHGPKTKIRLAIKEIAEHLHGRDSHTDDDKEARPRRGLIGRILAPS